MIFIKGYNNVIGGGGFHHIAIRAWDFDRSVVFYTDVLGFKKTISWGQGNRRAIMLDVGDGSCLEIFEGGSEDKKPEGSIIHFALCTDDCDKALERVRKAGMEITMEPTDVIIESTPQTPVKIAFFKGPDGEVIEFFQNK